MKQQIAERNELSKWIVLAVDFILVSVAYYVSMKLGYVPRAKYGMMFACIAYIIAILLVTPVAHNRLAPAEKVANRSMNTAFIMAVVFTAEMGVTRFSFPLSSFAITFAFLFFLIFFGRLLTRKIIKHMRVIGRDNRQVVFVGAGLNLKVIYESISREVSMGLRVNGYFDDKISNSLGDKVPLLGGIKDVVTWLQKNKMDILFCNLPEDRGDEIKEIMNYCENHLIRFYSVPNVKNYVQRAMTVEFVDDMPVLSLRHEPLMNIMYRAEKRIFDIVFSLLIIVFVLSWVSLIVAVITKITMPGPIFFKQKRNGLYGEEFWCYKFRSMKVNNDADRLQATKDDPRKTKWGNFMRKTNIDELPQFWNVLVGDMSVVGPRPHMVKHTEEYGALINKYMVRHYAKPGITGWAQVTGSRGETSELWMMEERIKKDIWYIENWSFWLDVKIIFLTIYNALGFEKGNAY